MNNLKKYVKQFLFPPKCPLCGSLVEGNDLYCKTCSEKYFEHETRVFNVPIGKKSKMLAVHTGHYYEGYYKKYVEKFKFSGKTSYAEKLSEIMLSTLPNIKFDFVTFVPMCSDKFKKRGYNQAELLAQKLSEKINVPCVEIFEKVRHNKTQHKLNARERIINVKNAYKVKIDISGQKILLIDDIITTGATMCECARISYKANAALVTGLCAANTR